MWLEIPRIIGNIILYLVVQIGRKGPDSFKVLKEYLWVQLNQVCWLLMLVCSMFYNLLLSLLELILIYGVKNGSNFYLLFPYGYPVIIIPLTKKDIFSPQTWFATLILFYTCNWVYFWIFHFVPLVFLFYTTDSTLLWDILITDRTSHSPHLFFGIFTCLFFQMNFIVNFFSSRKKARWFFSDIV